MPPTRISLAKGNIYTVNEKQPKVEVRAVKNGRFVFVGSNDEATRLQPHVPSTFADRQLCRDWPIRIVTFSELASAKRV